MGYVGFDKRSRSGRDSSETASAKYEQRIGCCSGGVRVPPEQTTRFAEAQLNNSRGLPEAVSEQTRCRDEAESIKIPFFIPHLKS